MPLLLLVTKPITSLGSVDLRRDLGVASHKEGFPPKDKRLTKSNSSSTFFSVADRDSSGVDLVVDTGN